MAETTPPPTSESIPPGFGGDIRRLLADLADMVQVRRELAEIELRDDLAASKRLGLFAGVGAVLALTALPLFVVTIAELLYSWWPVGTETFNGWLPILAGTLLLTGGALAWTAYGRFRRDFHGFRQSLAELQEDVEWLQEWARGSAPSDGEQ
jgi:uncharacterized membrane protein YqjE